MKTRPHILRTTTFKQALDCAASLVIPAEAGIHSYCSVSMDPRLRGDDKGTPPRSTILFIASIVFLCSLSVRISHGAEDTPQQLQGVTISENLGKPVDLSLAFVDHAGQKVTLADVIRGDTPVLLTLNYYTCKSLCSIQLNALTEGLRELKWLPGKKFRLLTISIDPRDTVEIANGKRQAYLESLKLGEDAQWEFWISPEEKNVQALAHSVGFEYAYDAETDQYAHPAAIFFISPDGKVARYLYGIEYPGRDLKFALVEASEGRVGSPLDKIILSCFHYDASLGQYGPFAFGMMRLGGLITILIIGIWLTYHFKKENRRREKRRHT